MGWSILRTCPSLSYCKGVLRAVIAPASSLIMASHVRSMSVAASGRNLRHRLARRLQLPLRSVSFAVEKNRLAVDPEAPPSYYKTDFLQTFDINWTVIGHRIPENHL